MSMRLFVASAPGLEEMLAEEVRALGADPEVTVGGVEVDGDLAMLYRLALGVGLGLRVLVRLGEFKATKFNQLVRGISELDWAPWLRPGEPVSCKASVSKSRLFHTGAIAQRVRGGIRVHMGVEPAIGAANKTDDGLAIHVRAHADLFTVSVDVIGDLLCRRGYRLETGKAPLREDLARALVVASGWDRKSPLADPMCGSGTIAIEAALLATGAAPGGQRTFWFEGAPCFDAELLQQARAHFPAGNACPPILASDRDAGVIAAARANAARAGVELRLEEASMSAASVFAEPPGEAGMVVCNPPFGKRVGGRDLRPLYQSLGERVRALPGGWGCAMVVADRRLATATGLSLKSMLMTDHGGGKIYLMTTE